MDCAPQRPPLCLRVPALILGVVCVLVLSSPAHAQTGFITNGDFEDDLTGWTLTSGANPTMGTLNGGVDGPNAVTITSEIGGTAELRSKWWLSPTVTAGAAYGLEAWVLDDHPGTSVTLALEFLREDGSVLGRGESVPLAGDAPGFRRMTLQQAAPAGSVHVRVIVEAQLDPGAPLSVDAVTLAQVGAPPTAVPTLQPSPPPTPTPTPRATSVPTATATPKASPTPPPAAAVGPTLRNATFEDGTAGWSATRGRISTQRVLGGAGDSLVLRTDKALTGWVEQAVTVVPGSWYEARALLAPLEGVRAAWLRIAWYASPDASGAQMGTDDSDSVGIDGLALLAGGAPVTTGPVLAPDSARSARVRILLQPASAGSAALAIDDVVFAPSAEPAPEPTASPTPVSTATPVSTPSASSTPAASSPAPASAPRTPRPAPSAQGAAELGEPSAQELLRITEVLADPVQPGRDADYEWVELTNLGDQPADLRGMLLRDLHRATPLPSLVVSPGASAVVAAALAEVDADARIEGSIGNGLGNEGDRLELVDAAGRVVDVFEYGDGTDLVIEPGEAAHRWFDHLGGQAGAGVGEPSPGVHAPLAANPTAGTPSEGAGEAIAPAEETATANEASSGEGDPLAWMLLIAVGGGAFGGVVAQRLGRS